MSPGHSFRLFVEQELGKVPHFVIFAFLEWILIALLFIDGLLALVSFEFAEFFDLRAPCLLCTRIDHILMRKRARSNYNDLICEGHKKDLSSVAYCHMHGKLADIKRLCEGCLLSFATDHKSDYEAYKSLNGAMNKEIDGLLDDEMRSRYGSGKDEGVLSGNESGIRNGIVCSCCGEPLKKVAANKSHSFQKTTSSLSRVSSRISQGHAPSPRSSFSWRAEDARSTLELTQLRCQELKMNSNNPLEDDDPGNAGATPTLKEEPKSVRAPSIPEHDDFNMEDSLRTPSFSKSSRFFNNVVSESAASSPRLANKMPRKSLLDKMELASDPVEAITGNETDTEVILNRLKRQVRADRKSLIALSMELDEERSASAVAANNAMAMITRLQAEKAAVQMEALQYQRMMEEQAEYDQEALQMLKELLAKREEEITDLESELDLYKDRYGIEKSQSFSSMNEKSEHGSPLFSIIAHDTEMILDDPDDSQDEDNDDDYDIGGTPKESHLQI